MSAGRTKTGVPATSKQKIGFGSALSKIEADYYAERSKTPPTHFKTRVEKQQNRRNGLRKATSNIDAKTVANIRWLREKKGISCGKLAKMYDLTESRVQKLCDYYTWAEVMPSSEGIDLDALQSNKQKD